MGTEKIDARKISTQAQQEKRDIAMRLRDAGMKKQKSLVYIITQYLNGILNIKEIRAL
jgi:hypothetical protein